MLSLIRYKVYYEIYKIYNNIQDILCFLRYLEGEERTKLNQINQLHPNLKFTMEEMTKDDAKEDEVGRIPFLDMELIQKTDGAVESEWYTKPTDTGIIMNWYAIAPLRYKTNLVMGFVNRIWSATTNYESFDRGCKKAKVVLIRNQYPKSWVDWQFGRAILKVYDRRSHPRDSLDRDGKRIVQKAENDTEN